MGEEAPGAGEELGSVEPRHPLVGEDQGRLAALAQEPLQLAQGRMGIRGRRDAVVEPVPTP
jgi:hypothetical protein